MTRRIFVMMSFYLLTRPLSAKEIKATHWDIVNGTLNHLFPKTTKYPNANQLNLLNFFTNNFKTIFFDKEDITLLIDASKQLYKMDKNFLNLSKKEKERLLRRFEQSDIGYRYLSTLLYYGFEAMLGDPIYGGNNKMQGWTAIKHNAGIPRPTTKYGKYNV